MQPSGLSEEVTAFRHFNRTYTRIIGTLQEGLLSTEFSLAEARVLYELATREEPNAKEIASVLELDQGYLSRILARFDKAGLIKRKTSKDDSRSATIGLTRRGRAEFDRLNALSDEQARTMIARLPPAHRNDLIASMKRIERILVHEEDTSPFVLRPHRPGDMGWVVHREGALYAEEYGWDETFEALVARIVADFIDNFDPKRERCWIAERDGQPVGHIFLVKHPDQLDTAKLRLLLVEPCARGKGLGRVLVNECVRFARASGYRKMTLWTQSMLRSAHSIYEHAGFRMVSEQPHHSFGKDLVGQTWELDLGKSEGNIGA